MPKNLTQILNQIDALKAEVIAIQGLQAESNPINTRASRLLAELKSCLGESGVQSDRATLFTSPEGKPFLQIAMSPKAFRKYVNASDKKGTTQSVYDAVSAFLDETQYARPFYTDKAYPGFDFNRNIYIHIEDEVKK